VKAFVYTAFGADEYERHVVLAASREEADEIVRPLVPTPEDQQDLSGWFDEIEEKPLTKGLLV
jgi:hypothetical protein